MSNQCNRKYTRFPLRHSYKHPYRPFTVVVHLNVCYVSKDPLYGPVESVGTRMKAIVLQARAYTLTATTFWPTLPPPQLPPVVQNSVSVWRPKPSFSAEAQGLHQRTSADKVDFGRTEFIPWQKLSGFSSQRCFNLCSQSLYAPAVDRSEAEAL